MVGTALGSGRLPEATIDSIYDVQSTALYMPRQVYVVPATNWKISEQFKPRPDMGSSLSCSISSGETCITEKLNARDGRRQRCEQDMACQYSKFALIHGVIKTQTSTVQRIVLV